MIRSAKSLLAALCIMFITSSAANAEELSDADRAGFQQIITAQLDAFKADDGTKAFSFAAPVIRSKFRTPEDFMSMVRNGYPPVYRPRSVMFGAITDELGFPTQRVHLIGPRGGAWTALYAMQRQDDGTWKISAVALVKDEGAGA